MKTIESNLVLTIFVLFFAVACTSQKQKEQASKPNIIFIYADDLGRGLLGVNGQQIIKTPHIDNLAERGMLFPNCHGTSYCQPARASLLTGLHDAHSNGWAKVKGKIWVDYRAGDISYQEVIDSVERQHYPIPDNEVFLPQMLHDAGYFTAQVGKLEWGFATTPNRLKRHGWDYHFGYYDHGHCHGYYPMSLFRNGEEVFFEGNTSPDAKTPGKHYSQNLFLDDILKLIRRHKNEPFFIYHPTQIPHGDIMIPEIHHDFINDDRLNNDEKEYASMVKMLDDHVGIIMEELEKQGIAENTIVIFSVDNGHETYYIRDNKYCYDKDKGILSDKVSTKKCGDVFDGNGGLSGKKFSTWEGGLRVPLIIKWNGKIAEGSVSNRYVCNYDLMPTLAEIVGGEMPEGKDGVSYLPTLLGSPNPIERDFYIARGLVRHTGHHGATLITKDGWKLRYFVEDETFRLHNLNNDPTEDVDLSDQYPEKLEELKSMFISEFNSPRRDIKY